MVLSELNIGRQCSDCFGEDEQTDQQQHSEGLLQEFYTMIQKHNEPIGWYAVRLDMVAGKV